MRNRSNGFTLIELMIAVAILGIIVAIAYPTYLDQVRKSRRADAQSALLEAANREERYYTSEYEYTATLGDGGLGMSDLTDNEAYKIQIDQADADSFSISAIATGDQVNDDCTKLTINQLGEKTANDQSASADISHECW